MKTLRLLLPLIAVVVCANAALLAQDKDKLAPMPAGSTIETGEKWFVKELSKNFGYGTIGDNVKISDLKFDGCTLSYRVLQQYTDQKAALGDRPGLGNTGAVATREIRYSTREDVSFDLKDIDPAAVGLGPLSTPKGMQAVFVETKGKKDLIKFERVGTSVRYNASGMRSSTVFPVKDRAGESLAKGLQTIIQLCQK